MKRFATTIGAPLLCLAALTGMWAQGRTRVKAVDAEPYHHHAKELIDALPYQLNGWVGRDEAIPEAAVKLLRPNCMISRTYVNSSNLGEQAGLLIVQCKDSRDMLGHYPPVCYPAHGMTMLSEEKRDFRATADLTIPGMEYVFQDGQGTERVDRVVYNFMIVPGVGFARDMKGVSRAAANYQERYFGATQIQISMLDTVSQSRRDQIFSALIGPNAQLIKTLEVGGAR